MPAPHGSVVQLVCAGQNLVSSTTCTVAVANVPAIGNHIIAFGIINADIALTSVGDTVNTWTNRWTQTTPRVHLADAPVTGDLTGQSITFTWASAGTVKCIYVFEVSGLDPASPYGGQSTLNSILFNGAARNNGGNAVTPSAVGDLVFAFWTTQDATETSLTAAAGYTNLPAATGSGYFGGTSNFAEGVYQIVTNVNAKTPTATGGSSPTGYAAGAAYYKVAPSSGLFVPHRMPVGV